MCCSGRWGSPGFMPVHQLYEDIIERLTTWVSSKREADTEILRFPPVMSRKDLEKHGYLKSFPQPSWLRLRAARDRDGYPLGSRQAGDGRGLDGIDCPRPIWFSARLPATRSIRWPPARGPVTPGGWRFDVASDCFRHAPSEGTRPPAIVPDARICVHRHGAGGHPLSRQVAGARRRRWPANSVCPAT